MGDTYIRSEKISKSYIKEMLHDEFCTYNEISDNKRNLEAQKNELELQYDDYHNSLNILKKIKCLYLKKDIEELNEEINSIVFNMTEETKTLYNGIIYAFKNNYPVNKEEKRVFLQLIRNKNFEDKEIVQMLEVIRIHNSINIAKRSKKYIDYNKVYEISDIINFGYEDFTEIVLKPEIAYELNIIINEMMSFCNNNDINDFKDSLYYLIINYKNLDEFKYIMINILIQIREELFNLSNELSIYKNYRNKLMRNSIIEKHTSLLNFYKLTRSTLDKELDYNKVKHLKRSL